MYYRVEDEAETLDEEMTKEKEAAAATQVEIEEAAIQAVGVIVPMGISDEDELEGTGDSADDDQFLRRKQSCRCIC